MSQITCKLPANAHLQTWWLAENTGRTVDEQVSVMVWMHFEAVERGIAGELWHSHHCRAAVKIYGMARLERSPASVAARALTVSLDFPALRMLDQLAARAHRTQDEQLVAVLTSYLRTLRTWLRSTRRSCSPAA